MVNQLQVPSIWEVSFNTNDKKVLADRRARAFDAGGGWTPLTCFHTFHFIEHWFLAV